MLQYAPMHGSICNIKFLFAAKPQQFKILDWPGKNWELNLSNKPEICEGGPQEHGRGVPHQASQGAGRAVGEYGQQQFPQAPQFEKGLGQHESKAKI
jgi:hypothetical protein